MMTHLEISLRKICKEGLGGVQEVGKTQKEGTGDVDEGQVTGSGQKRKRSGLLPDDDDDVEIDISKRMSEQTAHNVVAAEIEAWRNLSPVVIKEHKETALNDLSLINHYTFMTKLKRQF